MKAGPFAVSAPRAAGGYQGGQVILPLAHTVEHEEVFILFCFLVLTPLFSIASLSPLSIRPLTFCSALPKFLEVVRLENQGLDADNVIAPRDIYLLQVGSCGYRGNLFLGLR